MMLVNKKIYMTIIMRSSYFKDMSIDKSNQPNKTA